MVCRCVVSVASAIGFLLALSGPMRADADPTDTEAAKATTTYRQLEDRLKRGDLTIDWAALRHSYARSTDFSVDAPTETTMAANFTMRDSLTAHGAAIARSCAYYLLSRHFLDISAHQAASTASLLLGDTTAARYHAQVAEALLTAVAAAGSGSTPDSAIEVISVREEYAFLEARNLTSERQSLITIGDRSYDRLVVLDPATGRKREIYFDVTLIMDWWHRHLGK